MSQDETPRQHVQFLFIRTSRPVAVAACYVLFLAAAVCVVLAGEFLHDAQTEKRVWLLGFVLAIAGGQYRYAILRSDRESKR
jgi:hypothetical protein